MEKEQRETLNADKKKVRVCVRARAKYVCVCMSARARVCMLKTATPMPSLEGRGSCVQQGLTQQPGKLLPVLPFCDIKML